MIPEALPLQMVCEMARNLPASPWLLPRLSKQIEDPNTTVDEIEQLIRKDPGLASAILKIANSAYFSNSSKCDQLHEALMRLGNREVYRVAASTIAGRWLNNNVQGYGWEPGDICKHSLCVAIASEILAKETGDVTPEMAYTGGLLHDVGKLALAYASADVFEKVRLFQKETNCSWRHAEKELLGYDHTDVGGLLLEGWTYPVNLIEVALYYPRPDLAAKEHQAIVTHIHAAKHLALNIGVGVGEEGYRTELNEEMLAKNNLSPELLESLLPLVFSASEKILSAITQDGKVSF